VKVNYWNIRFSQNTKPVSHLILLLPKQVEAGFFITVHIKLPYKSKATEAYFIAFVLFLKHLLPTLPADFQSPIFESITRIKF